MMYLAIQNAQFELRLASYQDFHDPSEKIAVLLCNCIMERKGPRLVCGFFIL